MLTKLWKIISGCSFLTEEYSKTWYFLHVLQLTTLIQWHIYMVILRRIVLRFIFNCINHCKIRILYSLFTFGFNSHCLSFILIRAQRYSHFRKGHSLKKCKSVRTKTKNYSFHIHSLHCFVLRSRATFLLYLCLFASIQSAVCLVSLYTHPFLWLYPL